MKTNFFDHYRAQTIKDIFADRSLISVFDPKLNWLDIPAPDFLRYISNRTPLPIEGVPPNPSLYLKQPTYMIPQAHRLWITYSVIKKYFEKDKPRSIIDLGAFPFPLEIIFRDYMGFDGDIFATANLELPVEWSDELRRKSVELFYVDLDMYIASPDPFEQSLGKQIPLPDGSVDFVIFTHVIEHLYHPFRILKEISRVLAKKGKLLISTDNAQFLDAFLHIGWQHDFVHEPVDQTAAVKFTSWRGHNRYFSMGDLVKMTEFLNFRVIEQSYYEILYNAFLDQYFVNPVKNIPAWRANILAELPAYRNEIMLIVEKI